MHLQELQFDMLMQPQAYLDPGSGSFILQVVIAGVLGIGLAFRPYRSNIISGFSGIFSGRKNDASQEPNAEK